jgi:hypothetical protein
MIDQENKLREFVVRVSNELSESYLFHPIAPCKMERDAQELPEDKITHA